MRSLPALLVLILLTLPAHEARAAQAYDNCKGYIDALPATITTQGTWCLKKDIATSIATGTALAIETNNVTLDCNHFKMGGLGAGAGTATHGINAAGRTNITIRNCSIRGFATGIDSQSSSSRNQLIADSRFDGNTQVAIALAGSGHQIRGNLIADTGGMTYAGGTYGIILDGDADIVDNTVDGVIPSNDATQTGSYGIFVSSSTVSVIEGNRIRGVDGGNSSGYGIRLDGAGFATVEANHLGLGTGGGGGTFGISCSAEHLETVAHNRLYGFGMPLENCDNDGDNIFKL